MFHNARSLHYVISFTMFYLLACDLFHTGPGLSLVMYFTISMYLFTCIALHVIGSRYQVGIREAAAAGEAAEDQHQVFVCVWCAVCVVVVWCSEGRGVCCWWCGV
jgi:hypothetical protein